MTQTKELQQDNKIEKVLKLEKGATCFITEDKHAGTVAKLAEIIVRKEGKPAEAKLETKDGEFITVAKYLFVVDTHLVDAYLLNKLDNSNNSAGVSNE